MSEEHYLDSYLAEILPALGLDAETYAPYVTADNDDDDDNFDDIIGLLKASSETHSEDDDAWENFRKEVIKRRQDYISGETMRKVRILDVTNIYAILFFLFLIEVYLCIMYTYILYTKFIFLYINIYCVHELCIHQRNRKWRQ